MAARRPKKRNRSASSMRDRINKRKGKRENPIVLDESDDDDSSPEIPAAPPQSSNSLPGYDPSSPPFVPSTPGPSQPFVPSTPGPRGILILGKKVGSGAFGSVVNSIYYEPDTPESRITNYVGEPLQPRKHYAVKIQDKDETAIEMDILGKLGVSPYIMKVYGTGDIPGRSDVNALVSDMYTQTLDNRIKKETIGTRRRNFPRLVLQMFDAVAYLASKNIVHRDLHAGNIMFGTDPYSDPKIIDFGWSADTGGGSFVPFPGMPATEPYRIFHPPEQRVLVAGGYEYGRCTTKFDVYSMATNLIELVYDSSKNRAFDWSGTMPRDFNLLMLCTILKIPIEESEIAYSRYRTLDRLDRIRRQNGGKAYPDSSRMIECSIMISQTVDNICTHFEERNGYVRLCLSMPGYISQVLHDCLELEATRPTAAQAVQMLQSRGLGNVLSSSALKLRF